ncbi:MAG: hypothetical protein Udaeo2_29510 [Candidatus Udaeobacter sp.]|nr:MAG: hypothetical protein Udaeo2_29510 [Candidatus Udaeobacter sp.]
MALVTQANVRTKQAQQPPLSQFRQPPRLGPGEQAPDVVQWSGPIVVLVLDMKFAHNPLTVLLTNV